MSRTDLRKVAPLEVMVKVDGADLCWTEQANKPLGGSLLAVAGDGCVAMLIYIYGKTGDDNGAESVCKENALREGLNKVGAHRGRTNC